MSNKPRRLQLIPALAAVIALLAAGCGSNSPAGSDGGKTRSVVAGGQTSTTTQSSTETSRTSQGSTSADGKTVHIDAASVKAIVYYANCLHLGGIQTPPPNTTGHGPIINLQGVDTSSALYKQVATRCLQKAEAIYRATVKRR